MDENWLTRQQTASHLDKTCAYLSIIPTEIARFDVNKHVFCTFPSEHSNNLMKEESLQKDFLVF